MKTLIMKALLILVVAIQVNAQNIITVDNSQGAVAYLNDLQAAISNASNNDIIYIHTSETNCEPVDVNKPLVLIGNSHSAFDKGTMTISLTLSQNASNNRISGINITGNFAVDTPNL